MSMSVGMLDHYNVSTRNLRDTVRFYEEVLGLVNGPRPPFDFPGAWLYSEGHPVLHLNDISPTDKPQRPEQSAPTDFSYRPQQRADRAQLRRRQRDVCSLSFPSPWRRVARRISAAFLSLLSRR